MLHRRKRARSRALGERFAAIAALIVNVADVRIAAARLAENINRADLNAIEIAEGIADALENGMTDKELAESLGWQDRRNVYRYRQFHGAPAWLKAFATEVPVAAKKLDEHGAPVIDDVTQAQVHDIKKAPGLALTHLLLRLPPARQSERRRGCAHARTSSRAREGRARRAHARTRRDRRGAGWRGWGALSRASCVARRARSIVCSGVTSTPTCSNAYSRNSASASERRARSRWNDHRHRA